MSTHNREELNKAQLKEVTALARTLVETADELYNLSVRRHPELHQVNWLIKQTQTRIKEILKALGEEI